MPLQHLQDLERKIGRELRFIELKRKAIGRRIERRIREFEQKNRNRFDDEFRFFRSWIEKPLTVGAVAPSGKALARVMAAYVDPTIPGPIVELGPGTGPVTEALLARGIDPARLTLVEFDPTFFRIGPAAIQQAAEDAADAARSGVHADAARRTLRAVHLSRDFADPALARQYSRGGLRARVAELSAGARLDLPARLTVGADDRARKLP
jgi:hypothetical protein